MREGRIETRTYSVPGMHCAQCKAAVIRELEGVSGVQSVGVDLEMKLVTVSGEGLDNDALAKAIDEAGYNAELIPA